MPGILLRPVMLLFTLLTVIVLLLRVGYGLTVDAPPALDVFAACERPCWHGLELGTMAWSDVEQFFNGQNMVIDVLPMRGGKDATNPDVYVHVPGHNASIIYSGQRAAITSILVDRPGCPAQIVMAYGIPQKTVTNTWVYWLLYPQHNIKLAIPTGLHDAVTPKEGYYISLVTDRELRELNTLPSVRWSVVKNRIQGYPCV